MGRCFLAVIGGFPGVSYLYEELQCCQPEHDNQQYNCGTEYYTECGSDLWIVGIPGNGCVGRRPGDGDRNGGPDGVLSM